MSATCNNPEHGLVYFGGRGAIGGCPYCACATLRARLAEVKGERDALLAIDTSTGTLVRILALRDAAEARATRAEARVAELEKRIQHKGHALVVEKRDRERAEAERDSALDKLQAKVEECLTARLERNVAKARAEKLEWLREVAKVIWEAWRNSENANDPESDGYNELNALCAALAECDKLRADRDELQRKVKLQMQTIMQQAEEIEALKKAQQAGGAA